jgi:uncharacterized protein
MHGILSIERAHREPPRAHRTGGRGQRGAPQSRQEAGAGSFPSEPQFDSRGLGHRGESTPGGSAGAFHDAGTGADAAVSADAATRNSAPGTERRDQGFMKTAVLALIGFYRSSLSPAIPSSCRFYPTCSGYAYEAVSTWGVRHGLWLGLRRILRCRPFGGFGLDPVPPKERSIAVRQ